MPLRREPVTAPIVLEASSISEERKRRLFRRRKLVTEFQLGERVDPASAVPLVHLDRRPLDAAPRPGSPTRAWGSARCCSTASPITEPDASLSPSASGPTLDYNRPPRLHPAAQPNEFSLPQEPRRPDKMPFPLVMLLSPLLMSGVGVLVRPHPVTLLIALGMPMMMLANASGSRRQQKKRYDEQVDEYRERRVQHRERGSHLARRRARHATPQLPRPGDGAAVRDRPARAAVGAAAVGPGLPAPAHRHRRPPLRRHHQGPDARGPRGTAALDRPRRAGHHPAPGGRRRRHRRAVPRSAARSRCGRSRRSRRCTARRTTIVAVLLGSQPQPRLGLGEVAAPRPHARRDTRGRCGWRTEEDIAFRAGLRADGRAGGATRARREAGRAGCRGGSSCSTERGRSG